jgi:hypothetical protein
MNKVKTYDQFINEEINIKKALTGAALGASLAFSNPVISQTNTKTQEVSQSINKQIDTKISGWDGLKWGDSLDMVKEKFPNSEEFKRYYETEGVDSISLRISDYKLPIGPGDSIISDVFLSFHDRKLKSVEFNVSSESSNFKKVKNYFNTNYWQGNSTEDKAVWTGELGEIKLTESQTTTNYSTTGYSVNNYQTKIVISKSNKNFDMNQLTDSQKFDMLRNELINMKNEQTEVKLNLYKCHKEFKVGVGMVGAGLGLGILGAALMKDDPGIGKPVVIIGSVLSLAGSVVIIDSHKFIGRASLTGITVDIKDKKKPSFNSIQPGDYFLYMGPSQ